MANFQRIKSARLYLKIADQIKAMLESGELAPRQRLPSEREIAEQLGVSRTAVREAFAALEVLGLIEVRAGGGTFVKAGDIITPFATLIAVEAHAPQAREMMELRGPLETEAAWLAAQRALPENLRAIRRILKKMESDLRDSRLGEAADWEFHMAVAMASQNTLLIRVMQHLQEAMRKTLETARYRLFAIPGMPEALYNEHLAICEAIAARDADLARHRMFEHISSSQAKSDL